MPVTVEQFLKSYDPDVEEIAHGLRALVRRLVPDAEEKVHPGWKTVAYGRGKNFFAISPHKGWVNLQFHSGSSLLDPSDLLDGTGKSMRHVKLVKLCDVKKRALAKLIREAAEKAS
jgi:hypothetical protein